MFTIGDFSRITGLTVKTLRFYHEQGLLAPSYVDHETGYRYYDRSKIETARIITHLRSLDLSLEEIGAILRWQRRRCRSARRHGAPEGPPGDQAPALSRDRAFAEPIPGRRGRNEETHDSSSVPDRRRELSIQIVVAGIRMKGRYADCGPVFAQNRQKPWPSHPWQAHVASLRHGIPRGGCRFRAVHARPNWQASRRNLGPPITRRPVRLLVAQRAVRPSLARSYAKILPDYIRGKGYGVTVARAPGDLSQGAGDVFPGQRQKLPDRNSDTDCW